MRIGRTFKKILYSVKVTPYVFLLPFVIWFFLFFAYPLVSAVVMSFQKVTSTGNRFIGLENYKTLLNPIFFTAVKNSLFYTVVTLLLMIPIPMLLAILLNNKNMIWKSIFRSAMFIPALTSVVVAGTIFRLMFGELPGSLMNQFIDFFGAEPIIWLRDQRTIWLALFLICIWRWTGVNMVYYLSGLQQIPEDLYEAANIDGANTWQKFVHVTFPMLKNTNVYVLTISIYGGLSMFTESYMLFNGNSSPNNYGLTIIGYLYRMGWEQNRIGIASAVGCVLLVIVMGINLIQLRISGVYGKVEQ